MIIKIINFKKSDANDIDSSEVDASNSFSNFKIF